MKQLLLAMSVAIMTGQAHAEKLFSRLNSFHIQPQSTLSSVQIQDAQFIVDTTERTLTLQLNKDVKFSLNLENVFHDDCGAVIYTGSDGRGPGADLILTSVRLVDNSKAFCDRKLRALTEVELNISGGIMGLRETHTMDGEALAPALVIAQLQKFHFQSGTLLASKKISGGQISANLVDQTLNLMLYAQPDCPANAPCPQIIELIAVRLPLKTVRFNRCGDTEYVSETAAPNADSPLMTLTFVDQSKNRYCRSTPGYDVSVSLQVKAFLPENHTLLGVLERGPAL